jgi:hypothetical protein
MGHHREAPRLCRRRDQQVPFADRAADLLELKPDLRVDLGCLAAEEQDLERSCSLSLVM